MPKPVKHETLGTLKYDDLDEDWKGRVTLDAAFGKRRWPRRLELQLPGDESGPDARAVKLAAAVLERSATLADLLVDGLWAELEGRETEATHWWGKRKGLAQVNENLDDEGSKPIAGRDDLYRVMRPHALFVREDRDGVPTAGVAFHCEFEEEHGLDVLTDGRRVLGTGYALDGQRYKRFRKPKAKAKPASRKG